MIAKGQILCGYCDGYFGSSFGDKRIEAFGADWIVAREEELSIPLFATFDSPKQLEVCVSKWSKDHLCYQTE